MDHNSGETFSPSIFLSPVAEQQQLPVAGLINGHDNGIRGFLGHDMMQPTGHNTEKGSSSGLPWGIGGIGIWEEGSGSGSGLPWRNEATVGDIRIGEQGSGMPQANMVETDVTAAVRGRPGQKRNGKSKSAENSRNSRAKKKKKEEDMVAKMNWLQEENKRLINNQNESNRKLSDLRTQLCKSNEELARFKKACDELQIQTNSLSMTLVNMSSLQEENRRLQADKDQLMQIMKLMLEQMRRSG